MPVSEHTDSSIWRECLSGAEPRFEGSDYPLGVFTGEGIGEEVIGAALTILASVADAGNLKFTISRGGDIGKDAERTLGNALPPEAVAFCSGVFAKGGAILCGPGGGRFVYEIRRVFDLFFKISPLQTVNGVPGASRVRIDPDGKADILVVRENSAGIYQGIWSEQVDSGSGIVSADQHFSYTREQVTRFLGAAARLAATRTGRLTVVWKESGVPSISRLWAQCLQEVAKDSGLETRLVDIDLMAYLLVAEPNVFDVVATPNLFGDILGDLGAVLLGSRGVSYSGNFSPDLKAVYQTNHGAAYDLAGKGKANPAGQIFSLAMMLRESYGLVREAEAIENAVRSIWLEGWRTADVFATGTRLVTTGEMANLVAERAASPVET
jgi:3-isopropylmalate dehydrogenase